MHNPYAPNLFAVGIRGDMMGQRGNRYFSPYVRLFTSLEEAEKYRGDSVVELFEYCVADPDAVVRMHDEHRAYITEQ